MTVATSRDPRASAGIGQRSEALAGYGFVAVPMLLFLILNIGSILYALFISVFQWNIRTGAGPFIGVLNYQNVFKDPIFIRAIQNSLYYAAVWVPLTMAVGLFLAVLVNQKLRGRTFFRAAFYFPAIASSAAITVLWIFLAQPDGLFNGVREALGVNPIFRLFGFTDHQNWIGNSNTALNAVILLNAWTTSGTFMLFYLASLQTIPGEVYEAAAIDGAGTWQMFWKITFPLLKPGHFFVATVAIIGALQLFDQARIAGGTTGDPANALMSIVLYLYNIAFFKFDFDRAAAVGLILFAIIFSLTLLQRRIFGSAPAW
ncbi:MAG TPA: sugar ABC transporter permease [Candidatus Limnocylindrales bacterium]|nr:sugar ABC transporter permease [Candidatus Limnocylindrales bacterium]